MEELKMMKDQLISVVQGQLTDIKNVDTKELGEAIDMIKDLAEACYYCTITDAMKEENPEERKYSRYYHDNKRIMPKEDWNYDYYNRSMYPRYYGENDMYNVHNADMRETTRGRDPREGRSPEKRRMYMESQQMHRDENKKMKDLEEYLQELSTDITEMIKDATTEEKQMLKNKIATLSAKIAI